MLDHIAEWTSSEAAPALQIIGELVLSALDSVPLPLLVVAFLLLLSSLRPNPPSNLLPSYSPPLSEKSRLSPLCAPPALLPTPPSFRQCVFYPAGDGAGVKYVMEETSTAGASSVSGTVDRGSKGRRHGRSAKRFGWDRRRTVLGVVPESPDEKVEV